MGVKDWPSVVDSEFDLRRRSCFEIEETFESRAAQLKLHKLESRLGNLTGKACSKLVFGLFFQMEKSILFGR